MLLRLLWRWLQLRPGRFLLAVLAVAVGAAVAAALLAVALDIQERMAQEMRAYGANIAVVPKEEPLAVEVMGLRYTPADEARYIREDDLPKLKTIFWRHNIVAFAPLLSGSAEANGRRVTLVGTWFDRPLPLTMDPAGSVTVAGRVVAAPRGGVEEDFRTGMRAVAPWWQVEGAWAGDELATAMVGRRLARELAVAPGDRLRVFEEGRTWDFAISGLVATGGAEDDQLFVDLDMAQEVLGRPGHVEKVLVSALVKPDDALARRAKGNPKALPEEEFVRWYCSPYIDAIAYQIEEAVEGSKAKVIRQVAEAEGAFLDKMSLTMLLLTALALVTSGLGVAAAMTGRVYEQTREIGLMKALGADDAQIALQFGLEAALVGLLGGILGYGGGGLLAAFIGQRVFETEVAARPILLPVVLLVAIALSLAGSALPVRRAILAEPAASMRERL